MASAGFLGAVSGIGKGITANAKHAAQKEVIDWEAARMERLAKLKDQLAAGRDERRAEVEKNAQERGFAAETTAASLDVAAGVETATALAGTKTAAASLDVAADIATATALATEKEKIAKGDRKGRLDVANVKAGAAKDIAGVKADKWEMTKVDIDKYGLKQAQATTNPRTQLTYVQVGNKFLLYDASSDEITQPLKTANKNKVDSFVVNYDNPAFFDLFYEKYHYIPAEVVAKRR